MYADTIARHCTMDDLMTAVRRVAMISTRDEDTAQQACLEVYKSLPAYDHRGKFGAWATSIIRHCRSGAIKSQHKHDGNAGRTSLPSASQSSYLLILAGLNLCPVNHGDLARHHLVARLYHHRASIALHIPTRLRAQSAGAAQQHQEATTLPGNGSERKH